jgi:GrpB-like predicted nucleotidyltransferase (UPF0157 family)/GNAT superfamily N-acetyltransferase
MTIFLQTERLILKTSELSDLDNLLALGTDPEVMKYIGDGTIQTEEKVKRSLSIAIPYQEKYGMGFCSVFEKDSGNFVGQAGLVHLGIDDSHHEIEIAYRLHKNFWGKGYGTELVRALIRWGFEHLSVYKLIAVAAPENIASQKVLKKAGLDFTGEIEWYDGRKLFGYVIYKNDSVELVPYDIQWSMMAESEINNLRNILPSNHIIDIQHVGSTAISGMLAKPIIDIQIAVDSLVAIKQIAIDELKKIGYEYWYDNPDPERMFFVKGMPPFGEKRSHHVHIVEPASRHWQEKILFRDYLIAHPETAREYEQLKIKLAQEYTYDREQYTDAKTKFINNILCKARETSRIDKPYPMIVFLTGASGAGKTTILDGFNKKFSNASITCLHFDSMGVPSEEEMIKIYRSGSEWQKAMTYHWINKLINDYQDKKLVVLEGQVNLDFIVTAFEGFKFHQYRILLAHCENTIRHKRLHQDRNQPELINDNMDNWADFLKKQAIDRNAVILDTTLMNADEMVSQFEKLIDIKRFI